MMILAYRDSYSTNCNCEREERRPWSFAKIILLGRVSRKIIWSGDIIGESVESLPRSTGVIFGRGALGVHNLLFFADYFSLRSVVSTVEGVVVVVE